MLRHHFKTAWRNIVKNKVYSIISASGLVVGIAAALLIFIVVSYELGYDAFQKNYGNIYRIVTNTNHTDGSVERNPGIQCPAIDAVGTGFPQFTKTVAVGEADWPQITVLGNNADNNAASSKKFLEENKTALFTQPAYFDVFNTVWLAGNKNVLNDPSSIVLNKTLAVKYFGDWKNAMGKFLKLDNAILLKVNGVVEDAPENSDFPIVAFMSYERYKKTGSMYGYSKEWGSLGSNNQLYVMLPPAADVSAIGTQLNSFLHARHSKELGNERTYQLQPLKELHFDDRYGTFGDHSSNKNELLVLLLIGMLIICMASINYINLATAQALNRSKEVGIRKVLGSTRNNLIVQVMGETFLMVLAATFVATLLAKLVLPYISHISSVPADIKLFSTGTVLFLIAEVVVVTILSGIYPAVILSGYKPILALKSKITSASLSGISLRRILVVIQFSISQMLIIGTIVAVSQMNYIRKADLGFNSDAVLVLPAYSDSANISRMQPLKLQLLQNPDVVSVSFSSDEPSSNNFSATNFAFDHKKDEDIPLYMKNGDEDYIKTFGLHLIAGRDFTASDTLKELIVNETFLKKLGITNAQDAIGKDIKVGGGYWVPVVGVVKDFKTSSLKKEVPQLAVFPDKRNYSDVAIKLRAKNMLRAIPQIQKIWEKTYPEYAFTSHFTDETIARFYSQETKLALLYKIFAGIAIFISCLGLYGLISYMAAQKTKEVGIRKVLGASVRSIVILLSRDLLKSVTIAIAIAIPAGYFLMHKWLGDFAYRITLHWWIFMIAALITFFVALMTVCLKAIKAARANPVKSLKTE